MLKEDLDKGMASKWPIRNGENSGVNAMKIPGKVFEKFRNYKFNYVVFAMFIGRNTLLYLCMHMCVYTSLGGI